jgi:hypothetical protein
LTRSLSAEAYTALQQGRYVARDFIWIIAKSRVDGSPVADGAWSDVGTIDAQVIDPMTGGTQTRTFAGGGGLISISDIPLVQGITVQTIEVKLSQLNDRINDFVRTYECKQADIQIFRGLFDPVTRQMVAPATPRFVGFIDSAPITTPAEGSDGDACITVTCTSNTQELTRANSDMCSDASQRLRSATDGFFKDVAVVGGWQFFWGKESGTAT